MPTVTFSLCFTAYGCAVAWIPAELAARCVIRTYNLRCVETTRVGRSHRLSTRRDYCISPFPYRPAAHRSMPYVSRLKQNSAGLPATSTIEPSDFVFLRRRATTKTLRGMRAFRFQRARYSSRGGVELSDDGCGLQRKPTASP